eukprot:13866224-Ditylum_brightwellii.AAC.1
MEGVAMKSNKPMALKLFLKEGDWSLDSMCCHLVPSSSINIASESSLTKKYKKVANAGVVELGTKSIPVVEYCTQDVAIEAFSKQLGQMQGSGVRVDLIVRHCLDAFWEKAATAKII